jgi:oligosaccharide repeat unit polymerase
VPLFALFFFLYGLTVPLSVLMRLPLENLRQRLAPVSDETLVFEAVGLYFLALLGFVVGYSLPFGRRAAQLLPMMPSSLSEQALQKAAFVYLAAGIALYSVYLSRSGGLLVFLRSSYIEKYERQFGQGPLVYGIVLVEVSLLLMCYSGLQKGHRFTKVAAFLCVAAYLAFASLVGTRSLIAPLCLGVTIVYHRTRRRLTPAFLVLAFLLGYLGAALITAFRQQEGPVSDRVERLVSEFGIDQLMPGQAEFVAGFTATMDILEYARNESGNWSYGRTYLLGAAHIVPRYLYPNRGMLLSDWYVWRFYPGIARTYGGLGFSPVAEAYLNFGWFGPPAVFVLVGIVLAGLEAYVARQGSSPSVTLVYAGMAWYLCYFQRLDFELFLKGSVACLVPYMAAVFYAGSKPASKPPIRRPGGVIPHLQRAGGSAPAVRHSRAAAAVDATCAVSGVKVNSLVRLPSLKLELARSQTRLTEPQACCDLLP